MSPAFAAPGTSDVGLPAQNGGPSVGALKEVNAELTSALKRPTPEKLGAAIASAQTTLGDIGTLGQGGQLSKQIKVTVALYYKALGTFLDVQTKRCKSRPLGEGLVTGQLIRGLSAGAKAALGASSVRRFQSRIVSCLGLHLSISSSVHNADLGYNIGVNVEVPLAYNVATGTYTGTGTITKDFQSIESPGDCTSELTFTDGKFLVKKLEVPVDATSGAVSDVVLNEYIGGQTNESMTVTCPGPPEVKTVAPFVGWGLNFYWIHSKNANLVINGWDLTAGSPLATKHFTQSATNMDEDSLLVLTRTAH